LTYHQSNSCKVKKEQELLKEELKVLKEEVKQLKEHPTTTNNITVNGNVENLSVNAPINIMKHMTPSVVRDTFSKYYNANILLEGESGMADFTIDYFLTGQGNPVYLCTDRSRKRFFYYDNNKQVEDPNATLLTDIIATGSFEVVTKFYKEQLAYYEKLMNDNIKNTEIYNHWLNKKFKLIDMYNNIKNIRSTQSYASGLSRRLPKTLEDRKRMDDIIAEQIKLHKISLESLDSIKDELIEIQGFNGYKRHTKTGMVFDTRINEVVGKYFWNEEDGGFHDWKSLTEQDKELCRANKFKYNIPDPMFY
jgi:hypothetical protein